MIILKSLFSHSGLSESSAVVLSIISLFLFKTTYFDLSLTWDQSLILHFSRYKSLMTRTFSSYFIGFFLNEWVAWFKYCPLPFFQINLTGMPLNALIRGKKNSWMKKLWCAAGTYGNLTIKSISTSLNLSSQTDWMQVDWKRRIKYFIDDPYSFTMRVSSFLNEFTKFIGTSLSIKYCLFASWRESWERR